MAESTNHQVNLPPISLLETGRRAPAHRVAEHLQEIVQTARLADELGFARFWLAEHHAADSSVASPTVLAAAIAQATRTIRVGTAGVLLSASNPFRVACDHALLSQLFPDRIDLGIARAWPGANGCALTDEACPELPVPAVAGNADDTRARRFATDVADLVHHLAGTLPVEHRHFGAVVVPERHAGLETWMLGSRETSATLAAAHGLALALALFLAPDASPAIAARYRDTFRAAARSSTRSGTARVAIAVAGVCAETDREAARLVARAGTHLHAGVVGGPARCREQLAGLCSAFSADELVWVDLAPDAARRRDSLALLLQ